MFRNIDLQYVRNSVARLSERTYASGLASWTNINRLMGRGQYLRSDAGEGINELALVEFGGWCSPSQGNQAGTNSSKRAAVQSFHVTAVGFEVPTQSPLVKRALQGVSRAHAATGTPRRVLCPVSWGMFLQEENTISARGQGGRVLWLCLDMSNFY